MECLAGYFVAGAWDTAQGLSYRILVPAAQSRPTSTFSVSCVHGQGPSAALSRTIEQSCAVPMRQSIKIHAFRSMRFNRPALTSNSNFPLFFPPDGQHRSIAVDHAEKEERWKYFRWVNVPCPSKLEGPLQGAGRS